MKNCVNCQTQIPENSRYCLNCGAAQPQPTPGIQTSAADGQAQGPQKEEEMDWMARELSLDPSVDYEAQLRFGGWAERGIGCLVGAFFVIMGLLALIPTIPIMGIFGLPLALILSALTFFNVGRLQGRLRSNRYLRNLLGFRSSSATVLAVSVFLHLSVISLVCFSILMLTARR